MFDVNNAAKNLSETFRKGLPCGTNKDFVSKLIVNNINTANKKFDSVNFELDDNKRHFLCRVIAYTTCEIYSKLHQDFKDKQLDRICKKSTNKICYIIRQPLEEDSPENEIMTMVGFVLPLIMSTEVMAEKLRFNPVNVVKFILNIPKQIIKFINMLAEMRKVAKEYYCK